LQRFSSHECLCSLDSVGAQGPRMAWFVQHAEACGWRAAVFNRRGNGAPLSSPRFNLLGSVADTRLQVEHVQRRYPDAFLAMVGLSAGSVCATSSLRVCSCRVSICMCAHAGCIYLHVCPRGVSICMCARAGCIYLHVCPRGVVFLLYACIRVFVRA